jgi:hypothetical protein
MRLSEQLENLERDVAAEKTLGSDRNETAPWVFGWWVDVGGLRCLGQDAPGSIRGPQSIAKSWADVDCILGCSQGSSQKQTFFIASFYSDDF